MINENRIKLSLVSFCIGLLLVLLVFYLLPETGIGFHDRLDSLRYQYAILILFSIFLHHYIMAVKWRFVSVELAGDSRQPLIFYYGYVVLSSVIGQVIPHYVGSVGVRAVAMKFHGVSSARRGAAFSVYDHLFDLFVLGVLIVPAVSYIFGWIELWHAAAISAVVFVLAGAVLVVHMERAFDLMLVVLKRVLDLFGSRKAADYDLKARIPERVFEREVVLKLIFLSLLRYFNLVLFGFLIALFISVDIELLEMVMLTPLAQLATILTITPGGLGTMEWTWIGMLPQIGHSYQEASVYALFHRLVGVGGLLLLGLLSFPAIALARRNRDARSN
ncbi:MAG: lysylphosphatidylglycerol synthase transmembrane domain-containing protein [Sedimenticola sp.]